MCPEWWTIVELSLKPYPSDSDWTILHLEHGNSLLTVLDSMHNLNTDMENTSPQRVEITEKYVFHAKAKLQRKFPFP